MRGLFITFEGIDGTGKSTASKALARTLRQEGEKVYRTWEPTSTWLGDAVRRSHQVHAHPLTEGLLFMADRLEHTRRIRKRVESGEMVLCDRYVDSTCAYQGAALAKEWRGVKKAVDWLEKAHEPIIMQPDITFLFILDPKLGLQRIAPRGQLSKFEKARYLAKVQENYLYLASKHERIWTIDASMSKNDVNSFILGAVEKIRSKASSKGFK